MRTRIGVVAVALVCLGLVVGCERTTEGKVAKTTEPGSTATSSAPKTTTSRSATTTTSPPSTPDSPGDSNAQTITCEEFVTLDEDAQLAVVEELIQGGDTPFPEENAEVARSLADTLCQFLPDARVSEVLLGTPPS